MTRLSLAEMLGLFLWRAIGGQAKRFATLALPQGFSTITRREKQTHTRPQDQAQLQGHTYGREGGKLIVKITRKNSRWWSLLLFVTHLDTLPARRHGHTDGGRGR